MVYKHPSVETMMWTSTDGLYEPLPALVELLVVEGSESVNLSLQIVGLVSTEEFFFLNSACMSAQILMVLGLSELSYILALSLRVNGHAFNFNKSMSIVPSLKVMHTSSKSLICVYGFSFSIP